MPSPSPAVANRFLRLASAAGQSLTNMRAQKLVYIAHGWNLAIHNRPLTLDDPEAWDYGPVYRDLYNALRGYGSGQIARPIKLSDYAAFFEGEDREAVPVFQVGEDALVEAVWNSYGGFHAFQLSALTHEEGAPWTNAFAHGRNTVIGREEIRDYFVNVAAERQMVDAG